jgi:hypothetical protein
MRIDPQGEAYFNERLATAYRLPVDDLAVGRRFAPDSDFMYIAPSPRHAGGWPGSVWRVGALEGVKTQYRTLVTADAFVPLERLEPWQSFGQHGQRVVDIVERVQRLDADDFQRVHRRLSSPRPRPITRARIQIPFSMRAGSPEAVIHGAVLAAAERTDPGSVVDEATDAGLQGEARRLDSPVWETFLIVASDAATALFVDEDGDRMQRLERRFWRLIEPSS